jgi:phenylpropionate dioxygenase-like ring-hydroxylating dioxygenase large terminal subunit
MFLRNSWYAAAWASEVQNNLLARRIVDEPILLYRLTNGEPAALIDRCPHRFAPLSRGCKMGDHIRCGYHGLTFDAAGQCVANPLGGREIPQAAVVRALPAVERHGLVWIWPGDPNKANRAQIPDLSVVIRSKAVPFREGYLHVRANYQLAIDNLMDLSHAVILHEETLGPVTPSLRDGELRVSLKDGWIKASVEMRNVEITEGALFDQWLETEWTAPSVIVLTLAQAKPGGPWEKDPVRALHIVTPETGQTSHYFFGPIPPEGMGSFCRDPFAEEDEPMLAGCQERMGDENFWSLHPVILKNDAAAIQVRRHLDKMIQGEKSA